MKHSERRDFYVYMIFRPTGIPCYVGKGHGRRWEVSPHYGHNRHLKRISDKAGGKLPRVKIREHLTEAEAFAIEIAFIAAIGREKHGGPLVNQTDGGEGATGSIVSPETIAKRVAVLRGKKRSEESRMRMRAAHIGATLSDAHKAAIGAAHVGRKNTPETIERMRIASLARNYTPPPVSEETRRKLSLAAKTWVRTPETRAKIRAAKLGKKRKPFTAEHRAKTSATMKALRAAQRAAREAPQLALF